MMKRAISEYGPTATTSVAMSSEPKVSRNNIQVEHIRIDSGKSYGEVRAALEKLPRFDDRIRALLHYGEIARVKAELKKIQGDAGLVIFSVATHGDWLQILSGKRHAVQYVIGNVLVSTQMTRHELAAGFMPRSGSFSMKTRLALQLSNTTGRPASLVSMTTKV